MKYTVQKSVNLNIPVKYHLNRECAIFAGTDSGLIFQIFREPLLYQSFDNRAVDEFLGVAAWGVGIFLAEVLQDQFDAVQRRGGIIRYDRSDEVVLRGGELRQRGGELRKQGPLLT